MTAASYRYQEGPAFPFTPGAAIQGGRYELIRLIGEGGMGWVFEARDRERGQSIALKTLRAPQPANEFRLKREFRALADVRHPNLVRMHELGREGATFFVTMELIDGVDFESYVRPPPEQHLDGERLRSALAQLVHGVQALHAAGTLHRDLKPSNVLVDRAGRVVVLDFGLIHEASALLFAPERSRAGTPGFMAPEQAAGLPVVTASDWYSVGAMLYTALTGETPPKHADVPSPRGARLELKLANAPRDLADLARALLDPVPDLRPDGDAIAHALGLARHHPTPRLRAIDDLVGRTHELARLHDLLVQSQAGVPTRVLICGPAGIGKSALARAFLESAVRDGALALAGKCHERDTVPYKALDTIVDELSRYLQYLPSAELADLITPDLSALLQVFPVLGRVPQLHAHARGGEPGSEPAELRQRALAALKELLRRIGQRRPLLLFIDDLQWGDLDSARLLTRLMAPPDAPQLLLVAAYRDGPAASSPAVESLEQGSGLPGDPARTERLVLPALTQDEARQLLARLLAAHELPDMVCRQLASESAGNPLFATELALSWLDSDAAASGEDEREPLSLAALLQRRIARLPEAAAELLQLAVVASRPPSIDVLRGALSSGPELLWPSIDLLKVERFVQGQTAGACESIGLCHDRIRETVDAMLDGARRAQLHAQLAEAIVAAAPGEHDQLLDHLLGAGLTAPAGECAARAGDAASAVLAFDSAAQFYRRAIDLLPLARSDELGLHRKLADVLASAARCNDAASVYLELSARTREEVVRTELLRCAAVQALAGGDRDTGVAAFTRLFETLGLRWPSADDPTLVEQIAFAGQAALLGALALTPWQPKARSQRSERLAALFGAAVGLMYYERGVSFRLHTQFIRGALLAGEPAMRAHACLSLAWLTMAMRGASAQAFALARRASELALQGGGDAHALASSKNTLSTLVMMRGDFIAGEELAASAEQLTRTLPAARSAHKFARQLWISSMLWQGKLQAANRGLELLLTDANERGHTFDPRAGDPAEAQRRLENRRALASEPLLRHADCIITPGTSWRWESWFELLAALYRADLARAAELEEQLRRDTLWNRLGGFQHQYATGLVALTKAANERVPDRELRKTAERAAAALDRWKLVPADACAALVRAGLAALDGELVQLRACLASAAGGFFACGMQLYAHCARRALGHVTADAAGDAWIAEADAFMRAQGMTDFDRWTSCHVPAFERMRSGSARSRA